MFLGTKPEPPQENSSSGLVSTHSLSIESLSLEPSTTMLYPDPEEISPSSLDRSATATASGASTPSCAEFVPGTGIDADFESSAASGEPGSCGLSIPNSRRGSSSGAIPPSWILRQPPPHVSAGRERLDPRAFINGKALPSTAP